jgi:hypothetical protein
MKKIVLNIGGKDREFHFGIGFMGLFLEISGLKITELSKIDENPFKYDPILIYSSAVFALQRKGETADFSQYDVIDWIDESDGTAVQKFKESFVQSVTKDVPQQPENSEEAGK